MDQQLLCDKAIAFLRSGNFAEAERLYLQVLAAEPGNFTACHLLGVIRFQQGRNGEALEWIGKALNANPNSVEAFLNHGSVLQALGRFPEALASYDKALAIKPDFADALYNRGVTLSDMKRFAEALASYDALLAIKPDDADALINRGVTLCAMKRFEEALASYAAVLAIKPDYAEALYNRGIALEGLKRFDEALASYDKVLALKPGWVEVLEDRSNLLRRLKRFEEALACADRALAIRPNHPPAMATRGWVLCETNRVPEGLAIFRRRAEQVYGGKSYGAATDSVHKQRHDAEQRAYFADQGIRAHGPAFHLAGGQRLLTPAVNAANSENITAQWQESSPKIVLIDDLLSPQALEGLQRFCWGSTIWRREYDGGYLGAMPEHGFACPLLAQIADELRQTFPAIFGSHALQMLWGFKYDSRHTGIKLHADQAAVNVNFWITPDEANRNPANGGLVIWDATAPQEWDIAQYNGDEKAARAFLAQAGARPVTVPYRANRAVIFNSDLFHETDTIDFEEGYLNRRINITMLFGRRIADGR